MCKGMSSINDIPAFIQHVKNRNFEEAAKV
jgi:hypothetical protein